MIIGVDLGKTGCRAVRTDDGWSSPYQGDGWLISGGTEESLTITTG